MFNSSTTVQQSENQQFYKPEVFKPLPTLSMPFAMTEYHTTKDVLIPFNLADSNEGKFHTPEDAMLYIRDHCARHGITFKRSTALRYCQICQVYEQADGGYFCLMALGIPTLNRIYTKISRLVSTRVMKEYARK